MDEQQHEALLEEIRKLREDVRASKEMTRNVFILLVLCAGAVALEEKWFFQGFFAAAMGGLIVLLLWFGRVVFKEWIALRKSKAPPRMVIDSKP